MRCGLAAIVVVAALQGACGGPRDPVESLLARLTRAVEERDAAAALELLAPGFVGQGGLDRAGVGAELRRYFALYGSLEVVVSGVEAERRDDGPRVVCRVDVSGRPKDLPGIQGWLPRASAYRFELDLQQAGNGLLVARAAWERLTLPGEPAAR